MSPTTVDEAKLRRRARRSKLDVKVSPYLYIAPFYVAFIIVGLFPLLYTAYISTRKWGSMAGDAGEAVCGATCGDQDTPSLLANFNWVLHQPDFWVALRNTFAIFIISSVPQVICAMLIAFLLDSNLRAKTFWRMGVLLPYVVAPMAAGIIFSQIFSDGQGIINSLITFVGLPAVPWHGSPLASWIAIACIVNFRWTGYNALICLAAMQAVPRDLYEAAECDGASRWRQFLSITIPQLRPTLIFVIITATIGGLQIFDEPQMFSPASSYGGTDRQFLTVTQFLWKTGFVSTNPSNMGRAAAIAWLLFLVIVVMAILNFVMTSRISTGDSRRAKKEARK